MQRPHFETSPPTLELAKPLSLGPCLGVELEPLQAHELARIRPRRILYALRHLHLKSGVKFVRESAMPRRPHSLCSPFVPDP
jgi:hypothetical protein